MDELFEIFDLDLGELLTGALALVGAVLLGGLGVVLMLASLVIDGLFLWGLGLVVVGIILGLLGGINLLEGVF